MIVAIETKKTKGLGASYDQLISLALLSLILPCNYDVAVKFLVKETFLKKEKIEKIINELINLGLIAINDSNLTLLIDRQALLGINVVKISQRVVKVKKEIEKEIETPDSQNEIMIPYYDIIAIYHQYCPNLPKVKFLTQQRINLIKKRYKEFGLDGFKEVFKKVGASSFLQGDSGKWKASFDWILKKENFIKILEGNYDDKNKNMISI